MENEYRVVFAGRLREGFALDAVKQAAALRLKASAEQIEKLFSGRSAVLKKGLNQETAKRYVDALFHLGMQAQFEPLPVQTSAIHRTTEAVPLNTPSSDLEKTQLADPDALSRYLTADADSSSVPSPRQSETAKPVRKESPSEDPSLAPTLIVPRDKVAEIARLAREAIAATDPSNAPTLIVPRPPVAGPAPSATVVVEQGLDQAEPVHNPEQTLLANADSLADYFAASVETPPANQGFTSPTTSRSAPSPFPQPAEIPIAEPPAPPVPTPVVPAKASNVSRARSADVTEWVDPQDQDKPKRSTAPDFFALSAKMQLLITAAVGCVVVLILFGLNSLG